MERAGGDKPSSSSFIMVSLKATNIEVINNNICSVMFIS